MTREEAIKIIDCYDIGFYDLSGEKIPADKLADAFDIAIEALQTPPISQRSMYQAGYRQAQEDRPRGEWVKKTFGYGECPDCIDRQELIGSIQYLFDGLADSWVEASEKIIEIIREEPTVPQKEYTEQQIRDTFNSGYSCGMQNEWITDEPPVDGQEVIATVYWTDYGDTITAYGHYNARFDTWSLYSDVEGGLNKGFEVIAWMPLPEPYKGGDDK